MTKESLYKPEIFEIHSYAFQNFSCHTDWDVPAGLNVANGAGELLTKRQLDREGEQGPEITFYLELFDKQGVSAIRPVTVVVADEDDNPPSPGHRDALVYNYKGESVSVACTVTGHVKKCPITHYFWNS